MVAQEDTNAPETDAEPGDGPERTCAVTREVRPADALIRFVRAPDGLIVPDLAHKLPGRGVWISATREMVDKAIRTEAFAKSLKREANAPADLGERVDRLMLKRVCEALSLANKAGRVSTGFTKVEAAIASGAVAVLHGADASLDGSEKLDRVLRAVSRQTGRPARTLTILTIEEMSLALGRSNVVHAALESGGATDHFLVEAARLQAYRQAPGAVLALEPSAQSAEFEAGNTGRV